MDRAGKFLGSTNCRYCDQSLVNGGFVSFNYAGKKYNFSLTGGADHYLKHNINLNLISYSWIDMDKNIKLYTQFIGDVTDIHLIQEYINSLIKEKKLIKQKNLR